MQDTNYSSLNQNPPLLGFCHWGGIYSDKIQHIAAEAEGYERRGKRKGEVKAWVGGGGGREEEFLHVEAGIAAAEL